MGAPLRAQVHRPYTHWSPDDVLPTSVLSVCFLETLHADIFAEWSGINALLYYGPTLVHSIGLRGDTVSLVVSGGIGIVQFIAVLPAIIYIDRWGETHLNPFTVI